jgi:hypothetical protein
VVWRNNKARADTERSVGDDLAMTEGCSAASLVMQISQMA